MSKKNGKGPQQIPFGEITWVMNNLTEDELRRHDEGNRAPDEVIDALSEMLEQEWKLSVKWDHYSNCLQGSLIQTNAEKPNAGYAFSARSSDLLDVMSLLVFKYYDVAGGVLDQFPVKSDSVRG